MSKERNNRLTSLVFAKLQQQEQKLLPHGLETIEFPRTSSVDWLRLICIQQQRQIEALARVVSRLAPEEFHAEDFANIEGWPDLEDTPEEVIDDLSLFDDSDDLNVEEK